MNETLKKINEFISTANPDKYTSVSYNTYFKELTSLSNSILNEREKLKTEINSLDVADEIKNKILNLL